MLSHRHDYYRPSFIGARMPNFLQESELEGAGTAGVCQLNGAAVYASSTQTMLGTFEYDERAAAPPSVSRASARRMGARSVPSKSVLAWMTSSARVSAILSSPRSR